MKFSLGISNFLEEISSLSYSIVFLYFFALIAEEGFLISVQFSSVTQSCPTLCDPRNRSMPGLPVHHQLPEFTQIHVHRVSDAIQPSHPLSSTSPPDPIPPSIKVFSNESTLRMRWPKYWSFSFSIIPSKEIPGLISFRMDKTLESPLHCKEIQPVHSEGDQPWDFFGRNDAKAETPVLCPPHAKS